MENHLGEKSGDDCKKMYVTSILSLEVKCFWKNCFYIPKDRQFINNTCVDLSQTLYLKSLPKRKGTQKHT